MQVGQAQKWVSYKQSRTEHEHKQEQDFFGGLSSLFSPFLFFFFFLMSTKYEGRQAYFLQATVTERWGSWDMKESEDDNA